MDIIKDFWGIILSGVGIVIWLVRVEAKTKENAKDIRAIWRQRSEDLASHRAAREETNDLLAEVRADIKTLLSRMGK